MGIKASEGFLDLVAITDTATGLLTTGLTPTCTLYKISDGTSTGLTVAELGASGLYKATNLTFGVATEYVTVWAVAGAYTIHYPFKLFKVGGGQEADIYTDTQALAVRLTAIRAGYLDNLSGGAIALNADMATVLSRISAARAGYLDNLSAGAVALNSDMATVLTRLTLARAGYLDNLSAGAVALASICTEARLGELAAANLPADVDTLLTRLSATRAGYFDNLSAGAVALASVCTALRLGELDPANIPADIDTLLSRLTPTRAGYLDYLLQIYRGTYVASGAVVADAGNNNTTFKTDLAETTNDHYNDMIIVFTSGAAVGGQARRIIDYDGTTKFITVGASLAATPTAGDAFQIMPNVVAAAVGGGDATLANQTAILADIGDASGSTLGSLYAILGNPATAISTDIATLLTRLSALRAGYLDNLSGGAVALAADMTTVLSRLTALRAGYLDNLSAGAVALAATALSSATWTNTRAGYLDNLSAGAVAQANVCTETRLSELAAANLPADIDTLIARLTAARAGYIDKIANHLVTRTWFSPSQISVTLTAAAGDKALPSVVLPNIAGTIVSVYVGFKFRMVENTNAGANKLNGAQDIQVQKAAGAFADCINFVDDQFGVAASTREGGDCIIGNINIVGTVDVFNATYNFQWDEAVADLANLVFNDVQIFLIISYY